MTETFSRSCTRSSTIANEAGVLAAPLSGAYHIEHGQSWDAARQAFDTRRLGLG